ASSPLPETSRMSPAKFPASRYKSTTPPSSAHTSSAPLRPVCRTPPTSPTSEPDSNSPESPAEPARVSSPPPPPCPTAPAASHRSPADPAWPQSCRSTPSCEPPCPARHTQSTLPASPPPQDQGCSSASASPLPESIPSLSTSRLAPPAPAHDLRSSPTSHTPNPATSHLSAESLCVLGDLVVSSSSFLRQPALTRRLAASV